MRMTIKRALAVTTLTVGASLLLSAPAQAGPATAAKIAQCLQGGGGLQFVTPYTARCSGGLYDGMLISII